MRGRDVVRVVLGLLSVFFVAGTATSCTSSGSSGAGSSTSRVEARSARLEPGLIRQTQLDGIPGLEGLTKRRLEDASVFENPDPRGPCGAVVPSLDLTGAAIAAFATESGSRILFAAVVPMGEQNARAYMDAMLADAHPGCASWQSKTNTGQTQKVTPTIVSLPPIADQQTGMSGHVTVGAASGTIAAVSFRLGSRLVLAQYLGADPLEPETLGGLAEQMAIASRRLDS
jgi:hypothetical protein